MKRSLLTLSLVLAMTFGLVNLDFNLPAADIQSVIELDVGASDAEARPRSGGSRSRSFSRPRASKPRAAKPKPRSVALLVGGLLNLVLMRLL